LSQITSFASPTLSLGSYTVPSSRRLCMRPSSFVGPLVLGGLSSLSIFVTATRCCGPSSARHSVDTTYLRACKLQEFLHLQQGSGSVYEYSKRFNHSSQYDSYHSNTDEKKMALFRQGLNPVLCEHLTLFQGCTLNELVNASIKKEDACYARVEEERKKRPLSGPTGGAPPKYHLVYTPPSGQPCGPPLSQ
jgi:hypothetical protein